MKLYLEEDLKNLKKKVLMIKIYSFLCVLLFCVSMMLGILLSTYQNQTLFKVIFAFINTAIILPIIYLADKFSYYKHIVFEFTNIILDEGKEETYEVLKISEKPITLSDSSICYEVTVKNEQRQLFLYLSAVFDKSVLSIGKKYKLKVSFDYIKEIQDED